MSLLEIKNISKRSNGGFIIDGISFSVDEKGIYGFFGKNVEEKTVLAAILGGISDVDGGEVLYKGESLQASEKTAAKIKRKIGFVHDRCHFPSNMTVEEVLDFTGMAKGISPDKRARQIKEALEITGLSNRSGCLIENLKSSEKKRVGYANALIGNPDVLIVDEPIAAIDHTQRDEIRKLIKMLGKLKVVLLFAANPCDIESVCDYAGILSQGRLVAFEAFDGLIERLNKTVMALARIKANASVRDELLRKISAIEGVLSVRESGISGLITDFVIECRSKDGISESLSSAVTENRAEVVSLRFTTLGINDIVDAICAKE